VIAVPLNTRLTAVELDHVRIDANSRGLIRHSSLPVPTVQPPWQRVIDEEPLDVASNSCGDPIYDTNAILALIYTSGTIGRPRCRAESRKCPCERPLSQLLDAVQGRHGLSPRGADVSRDRLPGTVLEDSTENVMKCKELRFMACRAQKCEHQRAGQMPRCQEHLPGGPHITNRDKCTTSTGKSVANVRGRGLIDSEYLSVFCSSSKKSAAFNVWHVSCSA
jgi:hypothetical protein